MKNELTSVMHNKVILRQIFRYLLGIGSTAELLRVAKKYGVKSKVEEIRSTFLSKSTYGTSMFWRAFKLWTSGSPALVIKKEYGVDEETLQLADEVLTAGDIIEAQHVLLNRSHVKLDEATVQKVIKEVTPLCNKLAYQMRFIYNYDGGLSREGFKSDFLAEALRVVRHYDYTEEYAHLKNRVLRSIYNYWKRMIEYYTAKRRRRLVRTGENEFSLEVLSMDYSQNLDSSDPDFLDLHSIIDSNSASPEQVAIEQDFVEKLTQEIPTKIASFVDIIFGREYSDGFISWVEENHEKHPDDVSDFNLRLYATRYLDISKKELKDLGMLVVEMGESNEKRVGDCGDKERARAG